MCLIICKRDNSTIIPRNMLVRGMSANPHGWGVMWVEKDKVKFKKGFVDDDLFQLVEKLSDTPMAIHFRLATHGTIDQHNCHPFKVTENLFLMHNGIISTIQCTKKHMSDTWHYAKYTLAPMLEGAEERLDQPPFIKWVTGDVGSYNKLVMLRNDGKFFIVNEERGVEYNGLWLSNSGGLPYTRAGFVPSIQRGEKKTSQTTLLSKVTETQVPTTNTKMGGDKYFIGCLVRTPEYFGLPESAAYVYFRSNKAVAKGQTLSDRELKWSERCKKSVENAINKSNIPPGELEAWCRIMRKNFTEDYENTYKIVPFEFDREEARIPYPIDKGVKHTNVIPPVHAPTFTHWCTECHKMFPTQGMWFNTAQMNTPLASRKGTCSACYNGNNTPLVTTTNHSSYRPSDTVEWNCKICNKPNYYKDTWSKDAPSSADNPICHSCIYDEKRKAEAKRMQEDAEHCGLLDFSSLSEFEMAYWKDKSFLKPLFTKEEKKEEIVNAS